MGGYLSLNNNQLTSLEGLEGVSMGGGLYLNDNPATEIPAGLNINGEIRVYKNQTALGEDIERKYPRKLKFYS